MVTAGPVQKYKTKGGDHMRTTNNDAVRTQLSANCGCGFKTTQLEEAFAHAEKTGHTMSVLGEIRSTVMRAPVAPAFYHAKD